MNRERNPRIANLAGELQKARDKVEEGSVEDRVLNILSLALMPEGDARVERRGPGGPTGPRDAFSFWVISAKPGEQFFDADDRTPATLFQTAKRYGKKTSITRSVMISGTFNAPITRTFNVVTILDESENSAAGDGATGNGDAGGSDPAPEGTAAATPS